MRVRLDNRRARGLELRSYEALCRHRVAGFPPL